MTTPEPSFQEKIKSDPFRRTDLEIECEVKNARRNWKKGKISDEDFQRILGTMRHRQEHVLAVYTAEQVQRNKQLQHLKDVWNAYPFYDYEAPRWREEISNIIKELLRE